jgi:hypothetical protein
MHITPVATALASVSCGIPVIVDNLTMVPLVAKHAASPALDYVLLDDALASSAAEITEVSEHGSVPELRFINRGANPVLIVDGQELLGAKQNRVVNLTMLVAARSALTIPVTCVEAGRWRSRSRSFSAAPRTQYASGRAVRMAQVTRSIVDHGERMSDQPAVWAHIAEKSARMDARSATSAMEQIFKQHERSIESYVARCVPVEEQCGGLFAIDDRIIGFDLFDNPRTFRKLLPKLVRSYAVDAIDGTSIGLRLKTDRRRSGRGEADSPISHLAPGFLGVVAAAAQQRCAAVGVGDDVRLTGSGIVGAALVVENEVVHVSAFSS